MKLELKHLAPYLTYGLNVGYFFDNEMICKSPMVASMIGNSFAKEIPINTILQNDGSCKPILRPLTDLIKEIEHNGVKFVPIEWFEIGEDENISLEYDFGNIKLIRSLESLSKNGFVNDVSFLPYGVVEKLLDWNFDVFGLIEKGLAIDINTLENGKATN